MKDTSHSNQLHLNWGRKWMNPLLRRSSLAFAALSIIVAPSAASLSYPSTLLPSNICAKVASCEAGAQAPSRFFWRPPQSCASSPPRASAYTRLTLIPNNGSHAGASGTRTPNRFTLDNRYQPSFRTLQANGTPNKDVFVGTANVRDILSGSSGGGDTFVAGSGTLLPSSFYFAGGDRVSWEPPPPGESDDVILTSGASDQPEYIYVYTPLEQTGGRVGLPPKRSGSTYINDYPLETIVYGADWIQSIPNPSQPLCDPVTAALQPISSTLIALANPGLGALLKLGPIIRQQPNLIGPSRQTPATSCSDQPPDSLLPSCLGPPQNPGLTSVLKKPGYPRVPRIINLSVKNSLPDLLILPSELYSNRDFGVGTPSDQRAAMADNTRHSSDYMRPSYPIKVLTSLRVLPSRQGSERLIINKRNSPVPTSIIPTDKYPLFYFSDTGLLVFSSNTLPLGSRQNPGRVIAQLLDDRGRPLVLPVTQDQPVFQARFLAFKPLQPTLLSPPDAPAAPGPADRTTPAARSRPAAGAGAPAAAGASD